MAHPRWTIASAVLVTIIAIGFVFYAVVQRRSIDREAFVRLYEVGREVEDGIPFPASPATTGMSVVRYNELEQALATEASAARRKARNVRERKMVSYYTDAAALYRDAGVIWAMWLDGHETIAVDTPDMTHGRVPEAGFRAMTEADAG